MRLLEESGESNGYHIAVPVLRSAEEAEAIAEEMKRRLREWRPAYSPYSLTADEDAPQLSITDVEESVSDEPITVPRRERERQ